MSHELEDAPPPYADSPNAPPPPFSTSASEPAFSDEQSSSAQPFPTHLTLIDTTIATPANTPFYTLSAPLTTPDPILKLSRLSTTEKPIPSPLLTLTYRTPSPSLLRNVPAVHDKAFVFDSASDAASSSLGFVQANLNLNQEKGGLFGTGKGKSWSLDAYTHEEVQKDKEGRNLRMRRRERVICGATLGGKVTKGQDQVCEWWFVNRGAQESSDGKGEGPNGKYPVVAASVDPANGEGWTLELRQELGEREMDILVAVWVASCWKAVLDSERKGLGAADFKATLKNVPGNILKGDGATGWVVHPNSYK